MDEVRPPLAAILSFGSPTRSTIWPSCESSREQLHNVDRERQVKNAHETRTGARLRLACAGRRPRAVLAAVGLERAAYRSGQRGGTAAEHHSRQSRLRPARIS